MRPQRRPKRPVQMAQQQHPQAFLWDAVRRRFESQRATSTSPDQLLRGLRLVPLDGQDELHAFSLGFREAGAVSRSASISRDFNALSELVSGEPDRACYLILFVADLRPSAANDQHGDQQWLLLSYVPSSCSAFEAKRMAEARAALKADLGTDAFVSTSMWCVAPEQIALSHYMRALEASAGGSGAAAGSKEVRRRPEQGEGTMSGTASAFASVALNQPLGDASEAVWDERLRAARSAYTDTCGRLVGALEELEQTLCALTGDAYERDEPRLLARAHMVKHLDLVNAR